MKSSITTAQYVQIEQPTASVGDRMLAQLVDWLVLAAYATFSLWAMFKMGGEPKFFLLAVFLPIACYTLLMEIFNHGQSLGKMALKLRVVKMDGSTPTLSSYLLRWLLWIIDGPTCSFLGLVVMVLNRSNQRFGDLAAGTVVIKRQDYKKIQVSLDDYDYLRHDYTPRYPQAEDLSLEQVEIIRRTLAMNQPQLTEQLALKVSQKLGVDPQEPTPTLFLQRIERDYQYYALEDV